MTRRGPPTRDADVPARRRHLRRGRRLPPRRLDGRRYLDFGAGIAVVSLGHRHPAPLAAAHAQLDRLWHASNLYSTEPQAELAEKLSERFGGAQSFFCNSGTEAIEAAVKYARKATGKPGIVALEGSFHGRTIGRARRDRPAGEARGVRAAGTGRRASRRRTTSSLCTPPFGDDTGLHPARAGARRGRRPSR